MKQLLQQSIITNDGKYAPLAEHSLWSNGPWSNVVISGKDTHGQAALIEAVLCQGEEPPAQTHALDQTFYIIEGSLTFYGDGGKKLVRSGETLFVRRGLEHRISAATPTASILILLTPAP